jgi:hypothetical protein
MNAGAPYTIADGDDVAICLCLTPAGGAPSVKVRTAATTAVQLFPVATLVTASGATFTAQGVQANLVLTFDDGTLGWLQPSSVYAVLDANSGNIGNTNIFGNIINLPYRWQCDALACALITNASTANFALDIYSTPLGTPSQLASVAFDANTLGTNTGTRMAFRQLATPQTLSANTDYAFGLRQTTANAINVPQYDVSTATHFKPNGLSAETCYGVTSTAGATFADALATKRRRYGVYAHVSAIDIPGSGPFFPRTFLR